MAGPGRIQIQVALPYRHEPRDHPGIRWYLDAGYRIVHVLRATDQEAFVTLARPEPSPGEPPAA